MGQFADFVRCPRCHGDGLQPETDAPCPLCCGAARVPHAVWAGEIDKRETAAAKEGVAFLAAVLSLILIALAIVFSWAVAYGVVDLAKILAARFAAGALFS